ncbi:hypothetical protein D2E76_23385 [Mycobacteroides abscessus]|uniref:Uncharacterized protein n=2 Tax=Mycobacteroides abscessus TaxID=36809 RepID=A0ABD7HIB0_9MYCO|nr:hypothetical protein [Mycobacteroides abscessus]RIT32756.1 hypothetical protein D2E76_23385 [Mycobacteroides abscessus]
MSELEWAVQWEAATPDPDILASAPVPPVLHRPASTAEEDQLTPEQIEENAQALTAFNEAVSDYTAHLDADLANPERWQSVRSVTPDEAGARRLLADMRGLHTSDPLARNFQLVTSPPRVWTPAE